MKKTIKFSSEIHNIAKAEEILEDITKQINLNEHIYGNILLSLSEAINNAIIHGNKMMKNKKVTVKYIIKKDLIEIQVYDEGLGFDYKNIPDPTLRENLEKETGRGIFIIKNLTDSLEFDNNGSLIIMKFNILNNDLSA